MCFNNIFLFPQCFGFWYQWQSYLLDRCKSESYKSCLYEWFRYGEDSWIRLGLARRCAHDFFLLFLFLTIYFHSDHMPSRHMQGQLYCLLYLNTYSLLRNSFIVHASLMSDHTFWLHAQCFVCCSVSGPVVLYKIN